MKKAINLIIVAVLTFSLLTACSNKNAPTNTHKEDSVPQANIGNISYVTDFSNGLAFIQYTDDQNIYCIDKTGEQLFSLENCNIYNFAKFNDKIAMIETTTSNEFLLCDKEGNLYKAEDFGASRIVLDTDNHKRAFLDGYIILERREESYTGTKIEMSVIDSDFNTLVPFSFDFAELLNSDSMNVNGTGYCDGYLYYDKTIVDLRTGKKMSDRTQINVSAPTLSYWAYGSYGNIFEHLEWGDIYNELTGEVFANVKESETISNITFVGDLGLATYHTDNGIWFNIIDQNGTSMFQPIKAPNSDILFDGETILVTNTCIIENEDKMDYGLTLNSYDTFGNLLGEIVLEERSKGGAVTLNDGVIIVYNTATREVLLYNSTLEELF